MSFFRSDFIVKFIKMNRHDFHSLSLTRVHFEEHCTCLAQFLKTADTKITKLVLDDCDIGDTSISNMIADCKRITTLRELRLRHMHLCNGDHTGEILRALAPHPALRILDLSYNRIHDLRAIAALLVENQHLQELTLTDDKSQFYVIDTAESFTFLQTAMTQNISLTSLQYDILPSLIGEKEGQVKQSDIDALEH